MPLGEDAPIPNFSDEDASTVVLRAVLRHGACLVRDVDGSLTMEEIVRRLLRCPPIDTLYGTSFDVKSAPQPINIAYSQVALPLHMDLAYYESPPGLQLLHCVAQSTAGGENYFVDAHAAAATLRRERPDYFETLRSIPATFQKDHAEGRARPARYFYRRPHIETATSDLDAPVTAVFWSPPFEGPLRDPRPEIATRYYPAYRYFRDLLERPTSPLRSQVRLEAGDLVVWNQRRVLHGRTAIEGIGGGERHLRGSYCNIDDFLSAYRASHPEDETVGFHESLVPTGNRAAL